MVLEITERDALDRVQGVERRLDRLRAAGSARRGRPRRGISGLTSFLTLEPSVVELPCVIQGIDRKPGSKKIVQSMVHLCREMEVT